MRSFRRLLYIFCGDFRFCEDCDYMEKKFNPETASLVKVRCKLIFEYDGSDFNGWQRQPDVRTVQNTVEEAFTVLYQEKIEVIGQGRTDAGVHAKAQAAHTDLPDRFENRRILHAMKGLLPADVALIRIEKTFPDFHARFNAVSRSYSYRLMNRPSPLNRRSAWLHHGQISEELLAECAEIVLGEHNFINFCIPSGDKYQTTICKITESFWEKEGDVWAYQITGNRFLRHLVRRLVGTMVRVNDGKTRIEEFVNLLRGPEASAKGYTAPAHGLILEKVAYPEDET
jgi:tRNA pseudouridine38-40 synthase